MPKELFHLLRPGLERSIREMNPWWRGEPVPGLERIRRWAFEPVITRVRQGLAPFVLLRGPRRVGKTVLQLQVIDELIRTGVHPSRILRLQLDELETLREIQAPILEIAYWFAENILGRTLTAAATAGEPAFIFLDEAQNFPEWAPQVKNLADVSFVRGLVTGSSALRIEAGRDSLAGRVETIELGPLLLREIAQFQGYGEIPAYLPHNGLGPLQKKEFWLGLRDFGEKHGEARRVAFRAFSERGAYPVAHAKPDMPWEQMADFLNETVIRRAIQHDLRMGPRGQKRDEHLLEEVFRLACRYVGQSPSQSLYLDEVRHAMNANVGWQRILNYLKFLDGTLLVRLIEPLELRLKRRRGPSKLCLCDHALRAAWLQEKIPLDPEALAQEPHLTDLAGRIAESTVGYFFRSIVGLDVAHFPERAAEREVDFVLTVGEQRIPVEVKYRRRVGHEETLGLRQKIEKTVYQAPFGILITQGEEVATDDPRIVSLPLSSLLLMR
jgi:predicted AAA+ superfamily ATPase